MSRRSFSRESTSQVGLDCTGAHPRERLGTRTTGGDAFRIGYIARLAQLLVTLYWLLHIPVTGFPILGWVAMSAFLALSPPRGCG